MPAPPGPFDDADPVGGGEFFGAEDSRGRRWLGDLPEYALNALIAAATRELAARYARATGDHDAQVRGRFAGALTARSVIARATGLLAQRLALDTDVAYARLVAIADTTRRPVAEVASYVLANAPRATTLRAAFELHEPASRVGVAPRDYDVEESAGSIVRAGDIADQGGSERDRSARRRDQAAAERDARAVERESSWDLSGGKEDRRLAQADRQAAEWDRVWAGWDRDAAAAARAALIDAERGGRRGTGH